MQAEQHIKRLVRELVLPDQADLVLQRRKYWTPRFATLYLERCDELIFDDPHAGLNAAQVGPELVNLIRRLTRYEGVRIDRLQLRSLGILASGYRASDCLQRSESVYNEAFEWLSKRLIPQEEAANLFFRVAVLRCFQNRMEQALDLARCAIKIYRETVSEAERAEHLGEALTVRGFLYDMCRDSERAVADWSEAIACTDPARRSRIHFCASHNLAGTLTRRAVRPATLARVMTHIKEGRAFLAKRPRSRHKFRLLWLRGTVDCRFGCARTGEHFLRKARRGFLDMRNAFDLALVSIDLGKFLFQWGDTNALRELARETVEVFSHLCHEAEPNRALHLWKEHVISQTVTRDIFASTMHTLHQECYADFRRSRSQGRHR